MPYGPEAAISAVKSYVSLLIRLATFRAAGDVRMLTDSINNLIPQGGIGDPVAQALHHQKFRPRYGPGRSTAMCYRHQRVISPMNDQGGSRHGCQALAAVT